MQICVSAVYRRRIEAYLLAGLEATTGRHEHNVWRAHRIGCRQEHTEVVQTALVLSARDTPECAVPFKDVALRVSTNVTDS